jgi:quercetin dioxygenase-like cupin family protein
VWSSKLPSDIDSATYLDIAHQTNMSQSPIVRRPLLNVTLGSRIVTSVDVREITFAPNQQTGRHKHPCPVVGFVAEGTALLEVEGQPPQQLPAGSSFYEPAGTVILRFDNATAKPMRFIAHYLLNGSQELIEMLPEN